MADEVTGAAKDIPEEVVRPAYHFSCPPRNIKEVDWRQFQLLCELQCTQPEIAAVLGLDSERLAEKVKEKYGEPYMQVYQGFAAGGRPSLRRSQRILADKHPAMAIWLGRHWLDQNEDNKTANQGSYTINMIHYGKGEPTPWKEEVVVPLPTNALSKDTSENDE